MSGNYQAVSEPELIRLVREDDPGAFAELSARYLRLIRSRARLFQGPAAPEEEDLLQEGLLGLYVAAASFSETGGASFQTYAGTCIYNRMASAARKHGNQKNRLLNESLSLDSGEISAMPTESGPEDLLEAQDRLRELLDRVESSLSPLERRALALYLGGCKRSEVPERSGMSLKAFDNAMYRVREKMKEGREG